MSVCSERCTSLSWNLKAGNDMDERLEIGSRILQGFCANSAIFASSPSGWSLVNCTEDELMEYVHLLTTNFINRLGTTKGTS
jgi:hypothetical protein